MRRPRFASLKLLFALVAVCGVGLALAACAETDDLGISGTCVERLNGEQLCGSAAFRFCRERYDPDLNGDVCRAVLRENGMTVESVLFDQRMRERERRQRAERRARRVVALGESGQLGEHRFTVSAAEPVESATFDEYTTVTARAGRALWRVDVSVTNVGREPSDITLAPGSWFELRDERDRSFRAEDDSTALTADYEPLQPDDTAELVVLFDVRGTVTPRELRILDAYGERPEDGGQFLATELVE